MQRPRGDGRTPRSALDRARLLKERPGGPGRFDRHRFREVVVELTPALSFQILEVRSAVRGAHWARVWPTSVALSQWLLTRPDGFLRSSAVELGCGLGLVGMTLAHLNVEVESTDCEPTALLLTEENAAANALTGLTTGHLDWSVPTLPQTSFLLGSDVLYEQTSPDRLFALIHDASLLRPLGLLVLAGPLRRHAYLADLVERLRAESYAHESVEVTVEWEGLSEVVIIHTLRRSMHA